jgi:DNA polymerase III subunit delta
MKILPAKIDAYIATITKSNTTSCLLYGIEYGIKSLYCEQIINNLFPDEREVYNYEGANLDKDPSHIYSEVSNRDLIATPKALIVKNPTIKTYQIIENIINSKNLSQNEVFLIIIADELQVKSPLRKKYESDDTLAAIACYKDNEASIKRFIIGYFKEHSITYESTVIDFISTVISADRLILLNELNKINLYLGKDRFLDYETVTKILQEFYSASIDSFIDNFFSKDIIKSYKELKKVREEGLSMIAIIRMMIVHLHKLRTMKHEIDFNNSTPTQQIKLHYVFFNRVKYFETHLRRWSLLELKKIEKVLYFLEKQSKVHGEDMGYNHLWFISAQLKA